MLRWEACVTEKLTTLDMPRLGSCCEVCPAPSGTATTCPHLCAPAAATAMGSHLRCHGCAAAQPTLGLITSKPRCAAQQPYAKFQSICSPQTCSSKEGLRYDEHTHAAHKDAPLQEALPRLDAQCHHAWQSCATHKLATACCAQGRPTARSTSAS